MRISVDANNREVLGEMRVARAAVETATSFRGTWLPNIFTGVIASFVFAVIVIVMAAIYHRDPSIFALFKGPNEVPVAPAPATPSDGMAK